MIAECIPGAASVVTSLTPSGVMNRVISMAVSGTIRNQPPWSASSSKANTLGESKREQQNQPTVSARAQQRRGLQIDKPVITDVGVEGRHGD
jgi:hypothetical protein